MTVEELNIRVAKRFVCDKRRLFVVRSTLPGEGTNPDEMVGVLSEETGQLMLFPNWEIHTVDSRQKGVIVPAAPPSTSPE